MEDLTTKAPNLVGVVEHIRKASPFQKKAVNRLLENANEQYIQFAEDLATRFLKVRGGDDAPAYVAKAYVDYTKHIRREEMYFYKEGKYRADDYDEVYEQVYGQEERMIDYVFGLGMTQIFWPNHYAICRFFLDKYIPRIKGAKVGAEAGIGHAFFHSELIRGAPEIRTTMMDISPVPLNMAHKMIKAIDLDPERAEPKQCDIQKEIPLPDESLDAMLMGELIEHLQDGKDVLERLRPKLKKEGLCFFTTAANAPAEDHILLFRTTQEITDLLAETGWKVIEEHFGTLGGMSVERANAEGHNINYAAILQRAK